MSKQRLGHERKRGAGFHSPKGKPRVDDKEERLQEIEDMVENWLNRKFGSPRETKFQPFKY